ncbi:MAG: prephenate dehydrogenase/arogenate dehydrogenase family protein [Oscillospiraceae bacterium]|nr:prephenate dehydrogenase/arogenate dehydrogenase family protein [Oscillospiraceae bacterium]
MRIAYQGIPGSNSEAASAIFASNQGFISPEYIPAIHSMGVVELLSCGAADYGVMATQNLVAGPVGETKAALDSLSYRTVDAQWLPVHHCLFTKNPDGSFDTIASHIQALSQCRGNLSKRFPGVTLREVEDTAIAARYLADGRLPENTAVLCRKNAGETFGLHLVAENLEDDPRNMTEFILIKPIQRISKTVIVAGLGLLGGSMAKAVRKYTDCRVLGWNRTRSVAEQALQDGAIDAIAQDTDFADCDLLMPVLYPQATLDFLKEKIPLMKPGSCVVDLVGVKTRLVEEVGALALAHGVRYTGGHPMAGLAKAGYERSFPELYQGASMILVPSVATHPGDIDELRRFFRGLGFGRIKVCSAETHDRMIAHTSQLAHIVSNSYVKSPVSANYSGFAGGSYKDMTRIACLNEQVWKELFIWNKEALLPEIDDLIANMTLLRDAIAAEDADTLEEILRRGREAKERIDAVNPDQPSD